ncbi:MAG: hypothetical protein J2P48_18840 [Alphaproteobacteria bacterium]|nr:hypothetical protein [Alphaproteobacteria bacterium]
MPPWLPALLVIIVTALALTEAGSSPAPSTRRRLWAASIFLFGTLAIVGTVWQGRNILNDHPSGDIMAAPEAPGNAPEGTAARDFTGRIKALEDRIKELKAARQARVIPPDTAEKLAAHLRQFGNRHVIVSCIPDDIEAYQYANQIVNILKEASWNAQGPEQTKIFGDLRGPGINVYTNTADHSDTVRILLDSFAKFNIPYQTRVTPSQGVPDTETVELFIGTQQQS